jgi:hypothetical protein
MIALPASDYKAEYTSHTTTHMARAHAQACLTAKNVHEVGFDQLQHLLKQCRVVTRVNVQALHHVLPCVADNMGSGGHRTNLRHINTSTRPLARTQATTHTTAAAAMHT